MDGGEIKFYRSNGIYGFLSNLHPTPVLIGDREFPTAEHAYQFVKPKDPKVAEWLAQCPKPNVVSTTAHALLFFEVDPSWKDIKLDRMWNVLVEKFTKNQELRKKLVETGTADLVEDSKTDAFWGIGARGKGKNVLGRMLMALREQLHGGGISTENPVVVE